MFSSSSPATVFLLFIFVLASAVLAGICGTSTSNSFTKYSTNGAVCIIVNHTSIPSTQSFMAFYPQTDDYSLIAANGSYTRFSRNFLNATQINVVVEAGGVYSPPALWHVNGNTVSFFTAIIQLNNGKVDKIYWEDGCFDCRGNCVNSGRDCAYANTTCETKNCDIKFYVAWRGTDTSGQFMTSSGKTISKYRAYSINGVYQTVLDLPSQIILK